MRRTTRLSSREEEEGTPIAMGLELNTQLSMESAEGGGKDSVMSGESGSDFSNPTITPLSAILASVSPGAGSAVGVGVDDSWSFEALPDDFHRSPEPLSSLKSPSNSNNKLSPSRQQHHLTSFGSSCNLHQIKENSSMKDSELINGTTPTRSHQRDNELSYFVPQYQSTTWICGISRHIFRPEACSVATWIGFWSLFSVTMGLSTITPIRDAIALQLGVKHIPKLTLASSVLAFVSSVPIGWLFEAPDPSRRKLWKKMGLTRGETQGSSLALFYRFFALTMAAYAIGFSCVELLKKYPQWIPHLWREVQAVEEATFSTTFFRDLLPRAWQTIGEGMYIAFFLVVHLMKLHSISLVWGVTTEAMEYEDVARKAQETKLGGETKTIRTRLQRLALVGFGGTLGGILGRYDY